MDNKHPHIPYHALSFPEAEMLQRATDFYEMMNKRRTVRSFSSKPVPKALLEKIILTASSAPSGAHKQPWSFCLITNPEIKAKIREAAEKEEYINYHGRMSDKWLEDLEPIGTDWNKDFLTEAPCLIVVFKKAYDLVDGKKEKNYYVNESVGLAAGFLLTAIHQAGLVSVTHTPSPMNFLQNVLNRPENERAFLLIPVGYPAEDVTVPDFERKGLDKVLVRYD